MIHGQRKGRERDGRGEIEGEKGEDIGREDGRWGARGKRSSPEYITLLCVRTAQEKSPLHKVNLRVHS
jgi:hypothetical protein